jgi:hypothetical protein
MRVRTNSRLLAVMAGISFLLLVGGTWYERSFLPYFLNLLDEDSRSLLTKTLFYVGGQPVRVWFLIKVLFSCVLELAFPTSPVFNSKNNWRSFFFWRGALDQAGVGSFPSGTA